MARRYPPEVHRFIEDHVEGRTLVELVQLTNDACGTTFTLTSMSSYKKNHGLKSGTPCGVQKGNPTKMYPAHVQEYILAHYKGTNYAAMAQQLKARFGVDYTPTQIMAYYKNHKLNSGLTGHFKKGNVPFTKGKKGYYAPGMEKGWFDKGHQPWNDVPVGTVLEKGGGYLWKKVSDKPGSWLQNWRQLHLLIWEEANGPVPDGYRVIFKDGNRQNCALENLMLVSLAENAVMNRCNLRFDLPEHTETGLLIAKVRLAAQRKKKHGSKETKV